MPDPALIISFLGGSGLMAGASFLFRRKPKPKPDAPVSPAHIHRWKRGEDTIYFCLECKDRYLDGKPK